MPSLKHSRFALTGLAIGLTAVVSVALSDLASAQTQTEQQKQQQKHRAPPPKGPPPKSGPPPQQHRQAPPQQRQHTQQGHGQGQANSNQQQRLDRRVPTRQQNQQIQRSQQPTTTNKNNATLPSRQPTVRQGLPQGLPKNTTSSQGGGGAAKQLPLTKQVGPTTPPLGAAAAKGAGPSTTPALGVASKSGPIRQLPGPRNLDAVRQSRVVTNGPGGQKLIQEPGNRTIIKQNNTTIITRNETVSIRNFAPNARITPRPNGGIQAVVSRPGGANLISEVDANGHLLRRYRRGPDGREITFIDNRRFYRRLGIGVGIGILATAAYVALAPPVYALPAEKYIVDYDHASDDDVFECLTAPPVQTLDHPYSLEEIRYSEPLRARMRRIDLDNITFDFGSFEVTPDQYDKLDRIARGLARAIEANPAEVFLIEGHTDAVGTEEDNLSLSDRRAEAVAHILVEHFNIPLENLVTQGYGKQFLKINTDQPERANRRVAMRRITPILSQQEQPSEQ
ncbi:MAG: OmpA family protein [Proteobacteria bacterium]|nr:OmpA family protein [Pseudomonadota bacterium]